MSEVCRIERLIKRKGQILTIEASAPVTAAAERMKADQIGCLVVVDGLKIAGILSERDIVEQVVAMSVNPASIEVRRIMTDRLIWCTKDTSIDEAQGMMAIHNIRHLPVIENGTPIGMVSSRDIFALKFHRINTQLAKVSKEAEIANKAKSQLLSHVSHEIRTPMNGIIGMTELAMETPLTPEQRDCLKIVQNSAETLLGMVNNLLDFSEMTTEKLQLQKVEFDLHENIGTMIHTLGRQAEAKGLNLTCKIMPDVPNRMIGDPARLCQVLVNLTVNAIKFTDIGQITVQLEIDQWLTDEAVLHFSIADTGNGIPLEKQQIIFEIFQHAEELYTRQHEGLGLGLAISAHLVEQMGGKIWVESEIGKGSTFHFTVRLKLQKPLRHWEYRNNVLHRAEE